MTPVSLSPATPAARAADTPGRAPKSSAGDKFESLLARASDAQPDDRDSATVNKDAKALAKEPRAITRPARNKNSESDEADATNETASAPAAPTIKAASEQDADLGNPVVANATAPAKENDVRLPADVAAIANVVASKAPSFDDLPQSAHACSVGDALPTDAAKIIAPAEPATSTPLAATPDGSVAKRNPDSPKPGHIDLAEAASAGHALADRVAAAASADADNVAADEPPDGAKGRRALQQHEHADGPAPQTATPSGGVKSASWTAAAAALRQALQKSAVVTDGAHTVPQHTPAAAFAAPPVASDPSATNSTPAAATLAASARSAQAEGRRTEGSHANPYEAALSEVATAPLLTAIATGARQQSAGSHPDFGSGSASTYKAPLKPGAVVPVFAAPAGFATALETAAPDATVSLPPSFSSSHLSTVGPQIVKGLQMQVTAGGGDMRLTLTPEHLGTVSIEVRVEQDRVKATLIADTPAVRQWITAHQDDLRQRLDAAGLKLEDLVVKEDGGQSQQERQDERPAPQKRRTPRADGERQVFEVVA